MNFGLIQNGMLMGLLALAIPVIIHLLFRQKPRDVQIGSVRFLQQIMEKHRNRRKVMRWLLMSLRLLAIALLAFLFARPFLVERSEGSGDRKLVAILIDRSASMQLKGSDGNRLIDSAVDQAKQIIRGAKGRTQHEVAFFDHAVEPITVGENRDMAGELLKQLKAPRESYSATDYAAAFRWAYDVCTTSKAKTVELHVITDLQQSGLEFSEVEPMPEEVLVKVHDLGRDLPNNVAIVGSTPARLVVRPDETTKVEVSLLNAGAFVLEEVPVVLDLKNDNRTIHERQKIKLEPGSLEKVEFELPDLGQGIWQGQVVVELIDDELPFDNRRHLAIMSAPQYRILVLDGEPNEVDFLAETHHLQAAIRLAPKGAKYAESPYVPDLAAGGSPLTDYSLVVMANVPQVRVREAERLKDYLENGGGLIVFAGENVNPKAYEPMADVGLVPGEIIAAREAFDLPWRVGSWDQEHSVFATFNDPQHGDLRKIPFRGITEMKPHEDANVIASFSDGKPFVLEKKIGDKGGGLLWVNTSCDNEWSNWTQSELYLPIVHQMLGHITGLNAGGPVQEELIDTTSEQLTSRSPGIFKQPRSYRVVNVSPRESETERCTVEDFVNRFELNVGSEEVPKPSARTAGFGAALDVRQNEIWHWILFALVTVMIAEFFLSNRTVA